MITIKAPSNKFFTTYLSWLNPILHLSKGEIDILAALLTLHYNHRHYSEDLLEDLLMSKDTLEAIRKKMKINARLFEKLLKGLKDKGLIEPSGLSPKLTKYPKDGKFRLFIAFEFEK
jgi:DNA-binding MarR family transcriptional regulator